MAATAVAPDPAFTPSSTAAGGAIKYITTKPLSMPAGSTLHFTQGKGYYVVPADTTSPTTTPTTPTTTSPNTSTDAVNPASIMTPAQVQADAANTANAEVQGAVAPFQTSLQTTLSGGLQQQQQAADFSAAAAKLLGPIGTQVQAGEQSAANDLSGLAQGFSGGVQQQATQEAAAQNAQLQQLAGGGSYSFQPTDAAALGNALYAQNGFIPSTQLVQNAAAANQAAKGDVATELATGQAQQASVISQTQSAATKVQNEIASIIAKYPQYFTEAQKTDITNNLKAASINEEAAYHAAESGYQSGELTNDQAKLLQANTIDTAKLNAQITYQNNEIKIRGLSAEASALRAQTAAHEIDTTASRALHIVMLKSGTPLLTKSGQFVPVPKSSWTEPSASSSVAGQQSKAVKTVAEMKAEATPSSVYEAAKAVGVVTGAYLLNPSLNPNAASGDTPGNGSTIPATTNDPARAIKPSFSSALSLVAGEYPALSPKQVRAAVIAGGIKPVAAPKFTGTRAAANEIVAAAMASGISAAKVFADGRAAGIPSALLNQLIKANTALTAKSSGPLGVTASTTAG